MEKYFEKNYIADKLINIEDMDGVLWKTFQTLSHNVDVKAAMPHIKRKCVEGREAELDKNLAATALMMIGLCEALLSKLDNEVVEMAVEEVERKLASKERDELEELLRAALGIE